MFIMAVPTIDLANYGTEECNKDLAKTLLQAIRTKGFFYVTNFGISQDAVDTQFALGQNFYELPIDEKITYQPNLDAGEYNGYRPAGRRVISGGVKDKVEVWNMASKQEPCLNNNVQFRQSNNTMNSYGRTHHSASSSTP